MRTRIYADGHLPRTKKSGWFVTGVDTRTVNTNNLPSKHRYNTSQITLPTNRMQYTCLRLQFYEAACEFSFTQGIQHLYLPYLVLMMEPTLVYYIHAIVGKNFCILMAFL